MSYAIVHLSDIHFGQERGGSIVVNDDVKEQIIMDARKVVSSLSVDRADAIVISGDIAYAGKKKEYDSAWAWLDRLTAAVGCEKTSVQVVPGNHDIDRELISPATQMMINKIAEGGDTALDIHLSNEQDRELLYSRFRDYRTFAESYNCPLDGEGTIQGHRFVELKPGKFLKFHGINTALICSKTKQEEGTLLLGQRQRVIPEEDGTEVVVIAHHPLHWIQDSYEALKYIKNRARIFISGHEHKPAVEIIDVREGLQILSIASGATIPPESNDEYTYCYNVIEFSWDEIKNSLIVQIHPRIWDDEQKAFTVDNVNFKEEQCIFVLNCPKFNNHTKDSKIEIVVTKSCEAKVEELTPPRPIENMNDKEDKLLLLKFFRELTASQRVEVLVRMGALPNMISDTVTHNTETIALKNVFNQGRSEELSNLITEITSTKL